MLAPQLLNIVDQYLDRAISLDELEDWLVPRLPLLFKLPYSAISELVADIEVGLAELSDRTRTEDEFRSLLENSIQQVRVVWANYPAKDEMTSAESSNQASPTVQYVTPELASAPA